jgi:uncharacterized protein (DUF305 family)
MISTQEGLFRRCATAAALSLLACAASGDESHDASSPPANVAGLPGAASRDGTDAEQHFLAENRAAMARMMADMVVAPAGDVDRDFVAMMVPHHQGAIDMATALLRHGRNERLRRLAHEIVVTQRQEIGTMRLALGEPPPSFPSPTNRPPTPSHGAMAVPDQATSVRSGP